MLTPLPLDLPVDSACRISTQEHLLPIGACNWSVGEGYKYINSKFKTRSFIVIQELLEVIRRRTPNGQLKVVERDNIVSLRCIPTVSATPTDWKQEAQYW